MWFLGIFGDNVEAVLGKIKFILFYISGGIVAGLTQYLFLKGESVPILGASGAIAAITVRLLKLKELKKFKVSVLAYLSVPA